MQRLGSIFHIINVWWNVNNMIQLVWIKENKKIEACYNTPYQMI